MSEPTTDKEKIIDSLRRSKNARTYADLGKSLGMTPEDVERLVLELGREGKVRIHEPSARARVAKVEIFKERITARMLAAAKAPAEAAEQEAADDFESRLARVETDLAALARRLESEVVDLRRAVAQLATRPRSAESTPPGAAAELTYPGFRERCLELYGRLDADGQFQGRVPIPALRKAMADRYSDAEFDRFLLEMARESTLDLQTLANPYAVSEEDRQAAIDNPQQGLLFYVVRRDR